MALLINNACCRPLSDTATCEHKEQYLAAAAFVRILGINVERTTAAVDHDWWKVGHSFPNRQPSRNRILIWRNSFEVFGWEIVTSVLIHEYGHCFAAITGCAITGGTIIRAEQQANDFGRLAVPPHLVPARYDEYRRFFLQAYERPGSLTTAEQWLKAIEDWPGT